MYKVIATAHAGMGTISAIVGKCETEEEAKEMVANAVANGFWSTEITDSPLGIGSDSKDSIFYCPNYIKRVRISEE